MIGSSNVYRFYNQGTYKDFNKYTLVKCTDIESFKETVENLGTNDSEVVISVIENFLERAARDEDSTEGWTMKIGENLDRFMKILKDSTKRLPKTKFVVAHPITRPKCVWYPDLFDDITTSFNECFEFMKLDNVSRVDAIAQGCQ